MRDGVKRYKKLCAWFQTCDASVCANEIILKSAALALLRMMCIRSKCLHKGVDRHRIRGSIQCITRCIVYLCFDCDFVTFADKMNSLLTTGTVCVRRGISLNVLLPSHLKTHLTWDEHVQKLLYTPQIITVLHNQLIWMRIKNDLCARLQLMLPQYGYARLVCL